ncbi:hypothetical protein EYB26_008075 [Talaromyces marneffei]|uniref:uncharacterized protein n=1 Tax=Talaromyces marneffei TaxID=37727 RepID=UPI0012A8C79C|nr:uncharacterized protein EYB26_008075 [Talaromyces marneffei]QGA20373.1 hypothetical protein EYB26_008075 [Talaromyces marneffei]
MADIAEVKEVLLRVCRYVRVVRRCLGGVRDTPETSEKAILILCDILDLIYSAKDQFNGPDGICFFDTARLDGLHNLLLLFEATLQYMEVYLHPGGVGVREFRTYLLERTLIPRLEQYKLAFVLAAQTESPISREQVLAENDILHQLRQFHEMESTEHQQFRGEDEIFKSTDRSSAENFIALADLCNRRQHGSCQWILRHQRYRQWLHGSFRTLYCLGSAGIGKTFLSSTVIDSLQRTFTSPDVAIIFLFCHREKNNEHGCPALLQSVLAQLIYRRRAMSQSTESLYDFEAMSETRASSKTYQNAIRAEVNHFSKVLLIIDGLDTISDRDRFLNRMQKLPEHAQLFITLRDRPEKDNINYINFTNPEKDIREYVTTRLHKDVKLSHLELKDGRDPELQNDIIRYVVERSHGIFLLAQLHLDLLASYEEKALIHSALTHLPESLVESYAELMKRILSKHPNSRKIIYWALFCCKPLTVAELKYATMEEKQGEESDVDLGSFETQLLNETCGLFTIDAVTGTVNLVHKTAKDALERMSAASTVFATAHKEIAERCLTLISTDEIVDDCYRKREETSRRWCDLLLLDYAASNWGYHARYAAEEEQTIQVLITTFLNKISWRRPSINVGPVAPYTFPEDLIIGQYPTDWTPLHYLAYFDIVCRSKRLLEQNTNVNSSDNFLAITPLHCAAYRGNEAMVQLLLENGADINAQTNSGDTALHLATIKGHRKIMKVLLAKGTDTGKTNETGSMILHAAVGTMDDEATVPLLVKSNIDVNAVNSVTGDTGLHLAVQSKRPRILLYLLNKKATVDSFNKRGLTPLHLAAKLNNCEALPLLLERGAAVESRSQDGVTALHVAAQADNWIAFDLLLAAGADINAWDANGDTLLHTRASKRRDTAIISKLIDQGANIEARNSKGYTPLQAASLNGNKEMFFLLLDRGANIAVETPRGESLLHITPPNNQDYLEIYQALLERGLSVDALSSEGWKPIHQAAFRGTGSPDVTLDKSCEHLKLLVSHGADINSVTQAAEQETPLHLATRASIPRPSYILLLLSLGADVNAKSGEGKTALHLAAARGRESVFRILLDHRADPSIKASDIQEEAQPGTQSIDTSLSIVEEAGITAFDLARKNPVGALWFDEKGELHPMTPQSRRTSTATLIESDNGEEEEEEEEDDDDDDDDDDSETATGATTVTGGSSVVNDE